MKISQPKKSTPIKSFIFFFSIHLPKKINHMKKLLSLGFVAMMTLTVMMSSCNKYPEGPKITLLSAKARLAGDWKMTKFTSNGTDYTSSMPALEYSISKEGTYTKKITYTVFGSTVIENSAGTWTFNGDKTTVSFVESGQTDADIYTILELRNKELMLQQVEGSYTNVWTFTAQ